MNETRRITPTIRTRRHARRLGAALLLSLTPALITACPGAGTTPSGDESLEARVELLEAKEEIRSTLLAFAMIVDSADPAGLTGLGPKIHPNFTMDVVDFAGGKHHFDGLEGLVEGFGPIMVSAQANLAPSAIAVEVEGDNATAFFKFINSVKPPPELGLGVDEKVLLLAANTATFVREDGTWMLASIELIHSLAYPGTIEGIGD